MHTLWIKLVYITLFLAVCMHKFIAQIVLKRYFNITQFACVMSVFKILIFDINLELSFPKHSILIVFFLTYPRWHFRYPLYLFSKYLSTMFVIQVISISQEKYFSIFFSTKFIICFQMRKHTYILKIFIERTQPIF